MVDTYLSDQQKRIVELLAAGKTWAEAADELGIVQKTLEEQMRRVRVKRERCEATLEYLKHYGRAPSRHMNGSDWIGKFRRVHDDYPVHDYSLGGRRDEQMVNAHPSGDNWRVFRKPPEFGDRRQQIRIKDNIEAEDEALEILVEECLKGPVDVEDFPLWGEQFD